MNNKKLDQWATVAMRQLRQEYNIKYVHTYTHSYIYKKWSEALRIINQMKLKSKVSFKTSGLGLFWMFDSVPFLERKKEKKKTNL